MHVRVVSALFLCLVAFSVQAAEVTPATINDAQWRSSSHDEALLIKAQILLDRAHFSPGEIDGRAGENYKKALTAFAQEHGIESKGDMTERLWKQLSAASQEPVVGKYTLSDKNVEGPFLDKVPTKLDDMKGLKTLAYGSARERIAERFHMSEALLSKLNPGQKFERAGDEITVAQVADKSERTKAARLEVDKTAQTLKAFDKDKKLIAFYPITAGSAEKPAPSGELKVRNVARNPTYRYNPDYEFKGVRSKESFTIGPGPNNPVGLVWIALPGEGYGIHGTPEPSKISKTDSHGCIRLTNWDALHLANLVSKGTPVTFLGDESKKRRSVKKRHRR
ncbi:MAG TPA: L,D-transpeptidase [Bryobacteraceae bacterium]|nr:L,D-transpeptidase [Bryobacteraceae bacterium]